VVRVLEVEEDDQLVVASKSSNVQRINVSEIRLVGRATMGVRLMRLRDEGDKVIAVARLAGKAEERMVAETEAKGDDLLPEMADDINKNGENGGAGEDDQK